MISSQPHLSYDTFTYEPGTKYIRIVENQQYNYDETEDSITDKLQSLYLINLKKQSKSPPLILHSKKRSKRCYILNQKAILLLNQPKIRNLQRQFCRQAKNRSIRFLIQQSGLSNELLFGRTQWVKKYNSILISDDQISRKHCKIQYIQKKTSLYQQQFIRCIEKSRKSSLLRKIPREIIYKILEFLNSNISFQLVDCGSRNGTYVSPYPILIQDKWINIPILINEGWAYQFNKQHQLITPIKVYTSNWNQSLDVHKHNSIIRKEISEFKTKILRLDYYHIAPKYLFVPPQIYKKCEKQDRNDISCNCKKIALIILQVKLGEKKQFYMIGTFQGSNKQTNFQIGIGLVQQNQHTLYHNHSFQLNSQQNQQKLNDGFNKFTLNIFRNSNNMLNFDDFPKTHGFIIYFKGKWYICTNLTQIQKIKPIQINECSEVYGSDLSSQQLDFSLSSLQQTNKIWIKIGDKEKNGLPFPLNTNNRYRIRLGISYFYTIQFMNFTNGNQEDQINSL